MIRLIAKLVGVALLVHLVMYVFCASIAWEPYPGAWVMDARAAWMSISLWASGVAALVIVLRHK